MNDTSIDHLIDRLTFLEYEIRRSITVREDQEEDALTWQLTEAERCGITIHGLTSKGDLLGAVQTAVRAAQAQVRQ